MLRLEKISNPAATKLLDAKHPLGAGCAFSFAFGVFWRGRCEGVLTFGAPVTNHAVTRYGLRQCDVLELRKLWISDLPPKNSESRLLAIAARQIRKRYPQLALLLTYCGSDELATSYRAAGWVPQESHTYVREIRVGNVWYSVRDAQRKRLMDRAEEKKIESRRKWLYPLTDDWREKLASLDKGKQRPTTGTATEKMPSAPLTDTGSMGRTLAKTQAKSPGSAPQQAAASSATTKSRQSTRSTRAKATPTGSPPCGRLAAQIKRAPR